MSSSVSSSSDDYNSAYLDKFPLGDSDSEELVSLDDNQGSYQGVPVTPDWQGLPEGAFISEPTCSDKAKMYCTGRKVAVALAIIVALAVAIMGILALVGIHHPHTGLASLGNAIGQNGSIAMIATGVPVAALIKFMDWAYDRRRRFQYEHVS